MVLFAAVFSILKKLEEALEKYLILRVTTRITYVRVILKSCFEKLQNIFVLKIIKNKIFDELFFAEKLCGL